MKFLSLPLRLFCEQALLVLALIGSILLSGCGGGGGSSPGEVDSVTPRPIVPSNTTGLSAVVANGTYADELPTCALADSSADSCSLQTVPLLGMETDTPAVDDVMSRVVVSHAWMGVRFREALQQMPAEMLDLFKSITVIVIADNIRPSSYRSLTGAIYLDPNRLWLSNAEKDTIDKTPDFRSGFGAELQFVSLWRYVKDGDYAWERYSLDGTETRTLDDIIRPLAALLFHELAHAGDFFPPADIALIDPDQSVLEAALEQSDTRISTRLTAQQPLNSDLLKGLGLVLFRGLDADDEQMALTAEQVGLEFEIDGASDDYSYSSKFEDVAMLFEEVMMKYHFDIDRELAYTNQPDDPELCNNFIIAWGSRHRTGIPLVQSRAEFAVQQLLNRDDVSEYMAVLPDALMMHNQEPWCTVQQLDPDPEAPLDDREAARQLLPTPMRPEDMNPGYH